MRCCPHTAPRGPFRRDAAVSSWLYRIVVNACLDRLRRNKSHPTTELKDDNCLIGDHTPRVDTAIMVERALMRLPVEQRAAVVAVDMQGYSVAETARMLGVAEGTVKSRCSRARAKLAEALGYFDTAPPCPTPAARCSESLLSDAEPRCRLAEERVRRRSARPRHRRRLGAHVPRGGDRPDRRGAARRATGRARCHQRPARG